MNELKACRLCGSVPPIWKSEVAYKGKMWITECDCSTDESKSAFYENRLSVYAYTKDECISKWNELNTRPNDAKYEELLMAVARKFPNESRHETALRYITEAESRDYGTASEVCKQSSEGGGE